MSIILLTVLLAGLIVMAIPKDVQKGNYVQLSTFQKWNIGDVTGYKTQVIDSKNMVVLVWCKTCARHVNEIRKDPKIRGTALREIDKYVMGTNYVTKWTVQRHLSSDSHKCGIDLETLKGPVPDDNNVPNLTGLDRLPNKLNSKVSIQLFLTLSSSKIVVLIIFTRF